MAMEFVDGESLDEIIHPRRTLPLSDKISYLEQICAGLHFAHRAGIVHRDIKPANIMVDREGVVRVLDFGIARIEGSAKTQDGSLMGSLNYMSPEQMLGRPVDHRSDIFSVGSVAYELLCYQQAFRGAQRRAAAPAATRGPARSVLALSRTTSSARTGGHARAREGAGAAIPGLGGHAQRDHRRAGRS
jgi:serine/threonine-protein kinase